MIIDRWMDKEKCVFRWKKYISGVFLVIKIKEKEYVRKISIIGGFVKWNKLDLEILYDFFYL